MLLRTHDDRGRPVRLHWRGLVATGDPTRSAGFARAVLRALARAFNRLVILAVAGAAILLAAALAAANFGPVVIALILFSPVAVTWITLLAMSIVSTGEWFAAESRFIKAIMLRERRCPSCDYSIAGVEPAPDRCTVCPECAAAWRSDSPRYDLGHPTVVVIPSPPAPPGDDPDEHASPPPRP